jgi:hypothetical protein
MEVTNMFKRVIWAAFVRILLKLNMLENSVEAWERLNT